MNLYTKNPIKAFFSYPVTWLAVGVITLLHGLYTIVFAPTLFWTLAATVLDLAALALWFVFAFKSEAFRKRFNRMPYEDRGKEIGALIDACPEAFKRPARACVELIRKVTLEFPDQRYAYELELMLSNLHDLSRNQKTLAERARLFGDEKQKKRMESIMASQVGAVTTTLSTLKTFSGNLTLLAAGTEQSASAADELKDVNQGLKEVLEEL